MKIVIDIPNEAYELLKNKQVLDNIAESIIANGTPLPKGHGKLVDKEEMRSELAWNYNKGFVSWGANEVVGEIIDKLHTIIEADKEAENG